MNNQRKLRHQKVRARIKGTMARPRLVVFRSLKHIYGQIIDDTIGQTLVAASDLAIKDKKEGQKTAVARQVGELLAKKAAARKITTVVFDRGGFKYAGRIKALAEGCRQKIKF